MPDAGYYDRVNPELLKLIPPDAKVVLDVGCGAGALCAAYRKINPSVRWVGIEPNDGAADIARERMDQVLGGAVSDNAWRFGLADGYDDFDCLILGDVLEHMEDPWATLKFLAEHIQPGAQVLASIPNAGNFILINNLLGGQFDYADEGTMDRTHLRWFTLKSIREMFAAAGLEIFEVRGIRQVHKQSDDEQWVQFLSLLHVDRLDPVAVRQMRPFQWVIRAIQPRGVERWPRGEDGAPLVPSKFLCHPVDVHWKMEPPQKLHIHAVTAEACCARPRIEEPFAMLATIPGVKCTTGETIDSKADIAIIQRPRHPLRNWFADTMKANPDKLFVIEIDDHPEYLQGMDAYNFRMCHAIQVSTEALAEVARQYNPNVMVFENQIAELPPLEPRGADHINIFYGAQNREADWAPIMPALNRVIAESSVMIWVNVVHDKAFFDALEMPSSQKFFTPFCEYNQYRSILRSCDIALLPLEDTSFNRCKSDIKFLECAAEGVACLVTVGSIYTHAVQWPIEGALWYHDPESFEYSLRALIQKPEIRRGYCTKAYTYVRDNRLLGQHYRKRYAWYQGLIRDKQRLTQELIARVPELQPAQPDLQSSPA